jgi:hypothetical protein
MPVKTDRNDARAVAQVMRVGWYSIVHIKSEVSQELRTLLTNRKTLGDKIESTLLEAGLRDSASELEAENAQRSADLVFNVDLFNQRRGRSSMVDKSARLEQHRAAFCGVRRIV